MKDKVINLLDQIIEKNIYDDLKNNKDKAGESWNIFHLKLLKKTILEERKDGRK
jgi:hypothetical protein